MEAMIAVVKENHPQLAVKKRGLSKAAPAEIKKA
jgi:hypothetical protein